jgi:hypothetical protein
VTSASEQRASISPELPPDQGPTADSFSRIPSCEFKVQLNSHFGKEFLHARKLRAAAPGRTIVFQQAGVGASAGIWRARQ